MKKNKLIALFVLIPCLVFAQQEYSNIMLSSSEEQTLYFYDYQPDLIIKADYSEMSEAENKYPEQLMQSVLSATNQEWVDYNTLGGAERSDQKPTSHFEKIKSMDKEKNYFELHHKLTFNVGEIPTAIIKFFIYQDDSPPISGAMVMQNVNGRWYKGSDASLSSLSIIVMRLKSDVLGGVILGDSNDENINDLRNRVTTESGVELLKLESEFTSWYSPVRNEGQLNLYIDSETW